MSFFDGVTDLMEMCIFFLLGILSTPSNFAGKFFRLHLRFYYL